ncbi:MAG: prepilin-type N-terminal cleavage/methylation domain-containing protein [Phycisphaerales bacterium]
MNGRVRKAFTLVEILIVVVILGILAAIVVPQFTNATQDAQAGNVQAQLDTLNNQIELFRARTNAYPTLAQFNAASVSNPAHTTWGAFIDNGYLKAPAINPVNNGQNVVDIAGAAVGDGWAWDAALGTLTAVEYNEVTKRPTPGVP